MRRLLGLLACVLLVWLLPMEGVGISLEAPICREASPFLASYRREGIRGQDLACLYALAWESGPIPAYRESPGREPTSGTYTLENLEDTTEAAGKLRAIALGGYPRKSLSQLTQAANPWLLGRGKVPLCCLQSGEALLATQLALWQAAGTIQVEAPYSGWKNFGGRGWTSFQNQVSSKDSLTQQESEYTASNIAGLLDYLKNLPPIESPRPLVSPKSLGAGEYQSIQEEDGTWTVTVSIPLVSPIGEGDAVTLQAVCGEARQEQTVTDEGEYRFSFPDLAAPASVTVTIQGTQKGDGVYWFTDGTTRLLGHAQGQISVWGQTVLNPDRILRLTKTTPAAEGGKPLANIQFNVYLAATKSQLDRKEVRLSPVPTPSEVEACQNPESLTAILSTDASGTASYNFTAGGDPEGVYLVVEQFSAATTGPVDPFYITVPGETGGALDIHLENRLETVPDITLKTEDGAASYAVNQRHLWRLTAPLPAGLGNARAFVLSQRVPQGLSWEADSLAMSLRTGEGDPLLLVEGAHYQVEVSETHFRLSLTPAGMAFCAANGDYLEVTWLGLITQTAAPGSSLTPGALLEYENAAGIHMEKTAEGTSLTMGALHLTKLTGNGKGIAGAIYRLARPARPEDGEVSFLKLSGEEVPVVYLEFWPNGDLDGASVPQTVTGSDGTAWFSGLAYGSYYLVETRAAPGYRTEEPIPVTLTAGETQVTATARFLLPNTGSAGALVLTCLGLFATVAACWLLFRNGRERMGA